MLLLSNDVLQQWKIQQNTQTIIIESHYEGVGVDGNIAKKKWESVIRDCDRYLKISSPFARAFENENWGQTVENFLFYFKYL